MSKVTKNLFYNITGNIGSKVVSFLVVAIITRMFGSAVFGDFNIATAEYSYFYLFSVMGMNGYGLFLFAKETDFQRRQEIFGEITTVKTVFGLLFAALLLCYAFLVPGSHRFVAPFALLLAFQATDLSWALQALQDMKLTAYGSFITIGVNLAMLAVCHYFGIGSVYALIFAHILSTLSLQIIFAVYLKKKHGFTLTLRRTPCFRYAKLALPYMVSGLFAGVNTNIDMVIMGYMLSSQEVGYYSAGYKLINEFVALCAMAFTPLFPVFIEKIAAGDKAYMNRTTGFLRTVLMSLIVPCALVGVVYGKELLALVFGQEYGAGHMAFGILMVFVALLYYREIYGYTLTAAGKQSLYLRVVAISAAFNVVANLIFIPIYGIAAAAATTLASEVINLLGMRYYVKKLVGVKPENSNFTKLFLPLAAMLAVLVAGRLLNWMYVPVIVAACGVYAAVYFAVGVIDLGTVKAWIKKK